jgi:hypothetical protein
MHIALEANLLTSTIRDMGIGVFRNVMSKKHLKNTLEAMQDILKGGTTTMPRSHSGQGIFFSSKAASVFTLTSFDEELVIDNLHDTISRQRPARSITGTRVTMVIDLTSTRHLSDVFREFTNLTEASDYGFDKTEVRVELYRAGGVLVSRSQARRILSGLDRFRFIRFDFANVPMVGQAFIDEIYRVFQSSQPHITIEEENMNEAVAFMVMRGRRDAGTKPK